MTKYGPRSTARCFEQLLRDRVGSRPQSQRLPALFRLKIPGVVQTSTYAGAGKKSKGDQSPKAVGNSGVERVFDLAKVDGIAGVRKSRESMENVIEGEK